MLSLVMRRQREAQKDCAVQVAAPAPIRLSDDFSPRGDFALLGSALAPPGGDAGPLGNTIALDSIQLSPRLARLAEQIRRLRQHEPPRYPSCPSGLAPLDAALGGGLARGAVHEILALGGSAAACSVALLIGTRAADRHRWIFFFDTQQEFYPPGAAQLGVPLERLLVIHAGGRADALWACEQSLRCPAVAAAILPLRSIDSLASRRLQLAAEASGSLGLLLRSSADKQPTFAASRLSLEPVPGDRSVRRFRVSVLKLRGQAPPRSFVLELPDPADPPALAALHPPALFNMPHVRRHAV